MKVLVTGGNGFLGLHIIKELYKDSHIPVSLSRSESLQLKKLGVEQRHADIANKEQLKKCLHGIDAIIHTAAFAGIWGRPETFYQTNFLGTKNLVDLAIEHGIKTFVYTSTPSVVSSTHDLKGVDETIPYPDNFLCEYAKTKAMAERYVLSRASSHFFTAALRPHLIMGEGDPHILPRLLDRAHSGRLRIIGDGKNMVDIVHVENAALAHLLTLRKLIGRDYAVNGQAFFIAEKTPVELWRFINYLLSKENMQVTKKISYRAAYNIGAVCEALFKALDIYKKDPPMTRFVATQMAHSHYFDHSKAQELLGFEPVNRFNEYFNSLN
jgi:nucleoside-diphosphate-sugar epimerase